MLQPDKLRIDKLVETLNSRLTKFFSTDIVTRFQELLELEELQSLDEGSRKEISALGEFFKQGEFLATDPEFPDMEWRFRDFDDTINVALFRKVARAHLLLLYQLLLETVLCQDEWVRAGRQKGAHHIDRALHAAIPGSVAKQALNERIKFVQTVFSRVVRTRNVTGKTRNDARGKPLSKSEARVFIGEVVRAITGFLKNEGYHADVTQRKISDQLRYERGYDGKPDIFTKKLSRAWKALDVKYSWNQLVECVRRNPEWGPPEVVRF